MRDENRNAVVVKTPVRSDAERRQTETAGREVRRELTDAEMEGVSGGIQGAHIGYQF